MAETPGMDGTFGCEICVGPEITETPETCGIPETLSTTATGRRESLHTGRRGGREGGTGGRWVRHEVTCGLPCRREEGYDRYTRPDDYYRRREEPCYDRYRDHLDRPSLSTEGQGLSCRG